MHMDSVVLACWVRRAYELGFLVYEDYLQLGNEKLASIWRIKYVYCCLIDVFYK